MESKPILNWPAIWRTCLILLPIAVVLHTIGAVFRSYLDIDIPPEGISGGVGVLGVYVLIKIIDRMDAESSNSADRGDQ